MANAVSTPRANLVFEFMVCFPRFLLVRPALCAALLRHHPRKTGSVQAFLSPWLQPAVLRLWSLRPSHQPAGIPFERGFQNPWAVRDAAEWEQNKARESPPDRRMACENPSLNRKQPSPSQSYDAVRLRSCFGFRRFNRGLLRGGCFDCATKPS
jgi:hypothetical protein